MRRKVSAELLNQMRTELASQEAPTSSFAKTEDNNYPVYSAYVNKAVLVYLPKTQCIVNADGTLVEDPCVSYQHAIKDGASFQNIRCISGLHNDALGYDGDCPLCQAVTECNQVFSKKLTLRARQMNVDIDKDPKNPLLDSVKNELNGERVVKKAEKFLTVPIVVLNDDYMGNQTIDPKNFKAYFWDVREQHWNDKLMKMLGSQIPAVTTAYGHFYLFNYVYDTKGQEPTKMLAAKNVTYQIVSQDAALQQFVPVCEDLAKDFTTLKAVEVIKSVQLWYKEDLQQKSDNIMQANRSFLVASENLTAPAITNNVATALGNFGVSNTATNANVGAPVASISAGAPVTSPVSGAQDVGVGVGVAQGVNVGTPTVNTPQVNVPGLGAV